MSISRKKKVEPGVIPLTKYQNYFSILISIYPIIHMYNINLENDGRTRSTDSPDQVPELLPGKNRSKGCGQD